MSYPYGPPAGQAYPPPPGAQQMPPGAPQQAPPPPGYQQPPQGAPGQGVPPQGMPPQGMPPQQGVPPQAAAPPQGMPAPMQPGMGRIVLDCSYFPLAFLLALCKINIVVNGQPYPPIKWGKTPLDLPAGQHHIQISFKYMGGTMGKAQATIPVTAGQEMPVFYRAPMVIGQDGKISPYPIK